jgi:hypothetical protein
LQFLASEIGINLDRRYSSVPRRRRIGTAGIPHHVLNRACRRNSDSELLASWPLPVPNDWLATLNQDQDYFQLSAMRNAVGLNTPIGDDEWRREAAATFDLKRTFRPQGRPCKK